MALPDVVYVRCGAWLSSVFKGFNQMYTLGRLYTPPCEGVRGGLVPPAGVWGGAIPPGWGLGASGPPAGVSGVVTLKLKIDIKLPCKMF